MTLKGGSAAFRTDDVITAAQLKAARAMLGLDQKTLAELAGVSVPTVQRMEASLGTVRGTIESLTRIVEALDRAGVVLLSDEMASNAGGRGVRLKHAAGAKAVKPQPRDHKAGNVGS